MSIKDDFRDRFGGEFPEATVDELFPRVQFAWTHYFRGGYEGNEELVLNLIAHLMVSESNSAGRKGGKGSVASRSAGNTSVSYMQPEGFSSRDAFFGSTKYGQRVSELLKLRPSGPMMV